MSTICKLNPAVREARAARSQLLRDLAKWESDAIKEGHHENAAKAVGARDLLQVIKDSPYRTGARKNAIFRRVARELVDGQQDA